MDKAGRAQMQARIVLVVYRSEMARLARIHISPTQRLEWETGLRQRSLELLDDALLKLGGGPDPDGDARRMLVETRAEVAQPEGR
jgi:hypothetical protein